MKDGEGKWNNVELEVDEVAVLLGATLHHATAGLLRPSPYRVVWILDLMKTCTRTLKMTLKNQK